MRRVGLLGVLALVVAVVVACGPTWGQGASLTATARGPLVTLNWTAATPGDGLTLTNYRVDVDGVQVALIAAPTTTCATATTWPTRSSPQRPSSA